MQGTNGVSQFRAALYSVGQRGSVGPDLRLSMVGVLWHPAVLVAHPCPNLRHRDMCKTHM